MDQVRYLVASGALRVGEQLPSIRDLARSLSVNPTTVVKAYDELQHAGAIELRHGKGAFVASPGSALGDRERERILRELLRPVAAEARQLGIAGEDAARLLRDEIARLDDEARRQESRRPKEKA
jgi:GntR family transcriptional regulator